MPRLKNKKALKGKKKGEVKKKLLNSDYEQDKKAEKIGIAPPPAPDQEDVLGDGEDMPEQPVPEKDPASEKKAEPAVKPAAKKPAAKAAPKKESGDKAE